MMKMFFKPLILLCAVILLFSAIPPVIAGQTPQNESETSNSLEPMTVTAQKTEENVQDVPMGITAFTAQGVEDRKIESVTDLADFVPNFMIFCNGGPGMYSPSMRGIQAPLETLTVSAGLFVDGVPVLSNIGFEDPFIDVERVEVLRGPQGTLYGKNTETGAINIITRQPDNDFRTRVSADVGKLLSKETGDGLAQTYTANLSGPILTDKLFIGIAGKFHQKDGFIENTTTGEPFDDRKHWFGRAHLRWTPTDPWDISLVASKIQYDEGGVKMNLGETGAAAFGLPAAEYRKVSSNFKSENNSASQFQSLKIDYEVSGSLQLTSVTARSVQDDKLANDWDFSPATLMHTDKDSQYSKLSQELRLDYDNGRLKWLTGIYADKDLKDIHTETFSDYPSMAGVKDREIDGTAYAVFTNLTYPLSQRFSLVGGLRYETEEQTFEDHLSGKKIDDSWDAITPKLALKYSFSPAMMTYVSASKGYRSGGFNFIASDPQYYSFDEEELWSYEIGAKSTLFDNRLVVNACAYLMDISGMQVTESVAPAETYLTNAAEATGKGIELEMTARVTDGLSLIGGFGYIDIEFDEFKDVMGDYAGNKNPYAPEYTFSIGAQYRFHNGLYARADLIGYGEMYFDKANEYKRDAYQIVNAKIGYEAAHFDVYLYGKNIFDEQYDSFGFWSGYYAVYSDPGVAGLQVTCRF